MATNIYESINDLPAPGTEALIELSGTAADLTVINMAVVATDRTGLKAGNTQRVFIGSAGKVSGTAKALDLRGASSAVYNEGIINDGFGAESAASTGILFSASGLSSVTNAGTINGSKGIEIGGAGADDRLDLFNSGMISAWGIAITGGRGGDRIVNTGTIRLGSDAAGLVLIDLGAGNDFYDGSLGTATGGLIKLGAGNDTAYGGSGAETFVAGIGSNVIDGGGINDVNDKDTVDYSEYATGTRGITINLNTLTSQHTGYGFDTLRNIENVIGTSNDDSLIAGSGRNTLVGGGGNDTLDGGFGNDRLEGGEGNDTVRYTGFSAVTVDLTKEGQEQPTGGSDGDTLISIENLEGGSGSDKLIGNAQANKLSGEGNNDTLTGGGGNDTLDGGTGQNTAVFSGASSQYTITKTESGFTVADNQSGRDGSDTLTKIRFAKFSDKTVALSNENPTSVFPTSASVQESAAPGATVATFFGSDPDGDTLTYSLVTNAGGLFAIEEDKLILKGAVDYEAVKSYSLTLKASDGWGGELTKTLTISVRNVVETTPLNLRGTKKADQLLGEAGNDTLRGLDGDDFLSGNAGNDRLYGGKGKDTLFGGAGKDIFVLDAKPTSKSIDSFSDFNVKDDTIHLVRSAFTKLKKGKLSKDAFVVGDRVHDAEDRIIYLKKAGALFYDPDGIGSAQAVQIATIGKNLKLTHNDFFVV